MFSKCGFRRTLCHLVLYASHPSLDVTGNIAGEHSWAYIWDKEAKHDRFFGSLAMRAFRHGHLLYHPAQWYEAGHLRNRALDLVELRARNVGYNYRGQPGLTTTDQSKVVGFSSFAAALLHLAQLKANFGGESKASLRLNRQRRARRAAIPCPCAHARLCFS